MTSFVLSLKELKSLRLREASTAVGMVVNDEIYKRLANNHTHLNWLTGVFPNLTATALENGDVRWPFQHQVPGEGIRDNLFYVLERNIVVMGDYRFGKFWCEYFAVIMTGQPLLSSGSRRVKPVKALSNQPLVPSAKSFFKKLLRSTCVTGHDALHELHPISDS